LIFFKFIGNWDNNKKNGTGVLIKADGSLFEGEFKDSN